MTRHMAEAEMKEVKVLLTDEQFNALAQVAYDAERLYGQYIPLTAVIMAASMKGLGAVRYEMESAKKNELHKIRLVK